MRWKPTVTDAMITSFKLDVQAATDATVNFYNKGASYSANSVTQNKIENLMNKGFNAIIVMTMFLCFFALSANMSANLYQQTKEIAVLRSLGITKWRIRMLYFYEAMVLVLASCIMGIMVGMVVGYTMTI